MKLLELSISNFLSFGKEEIIDLSEVGLYLICGENGVGKSSILDALTFAVYGYPVRNINLPKLINEQIQENCKVGLKFEISGTIYWIERYRKHEKYKDSLRIFKGTHDEEGLISKSDSKDAQEQLDGIIKMNYKAFMNTIMLTQEDIAGFIEANPAKKKEIIESILQLDSFTQYHKIAQDKRKMKKSAIDVINADIKSNERVTENIKKSMEDYVESCKQQKAKDKKEIAELENELTGLKEINVEEEFDKIKQAEELTKKRTELKLSMQSFLDRIALLKKEESSFSDSMNEYNKLIVSSQKRVEKIRKSTSDLSVQKNNLQAKIDDAIAHPDNCPFCGGEINADLHKKYIEDNTKSVADMQRTMDDNEHNIDSEEVNSNDWVNKVNELLIKRNEITAKINTEKKSMESIKAEYDDIEIPDTMDIKELQEIADKISSVETKINAFKSKEYVDKNYLASSKSKLVEVMDELKELKIKYDASMKELQLLQFWEDSLSSKKNSIKSWCINNIVGYFNARIKHYIDRFFEGSVSIQFDNELNEVIKFKKYDRDFKQFSGGQRRRLNIAILFALHSLVKANVSNKIDIMFLDEVLSNYLDDKGISIVLDLLEEMKDNNESVWVIDHKDNFKNFPAFKRVDVWLDKKEFSHIRIN